MSTIVENLSKVRLMNRQRPGSDLRQMVPAEYVPRTCVVTCILGVRRRGVGVAVLHRTASGSDWWFVSDERLEDVNYDVWEDCKRWIARLHEGDEA